MGDYLQLITNTFDLNLGKYSLPIAYWQAGAIVFLLFLLVLSVAQFRRHYIDWSLKGAVAGVFFGFLLALLLEGFLLIGGRTALTGVLGWKNPPLPIARVLDMGRSKLVQVLGANTVIPSTFARENTDIESTVEIIQNMSPADQKSLKAILCKP